VWSATTYTNYTATKAIYQEQLPLRNLSPGRTRRAHGEIIKH